MPGSMFWNRAACALAACATLATAGCAGHAPPSPSEQKFVSNASALLIAEFPTRAAAERAGYMALADKLDSDNTYDLSDMEFRDIPLARPNFLWFDRHGKLVGTDYEFPKSLYPKPPTVFPVDEARWTSIDEHVHLAYMLDGKIVFAEHPAKDNLRKAVIAVSDLRADGFLPDGATLRWAMYHPAAWDLAFWLVPNPNGAFADDDPLVK